MFNFFRKKEGPVQLKERIWMTEEAKWERLKLLMNKDAITLVCWFEDTWQKASAIIGQPANGSAILLAREAANLHLPADTHIIFAEHYPLREKEESLYEKMPLKNAEVWSAMNEPLFTAFGGEKIVQMMRQLGMDEKESVEHKMISKAIHNAQDKIAKKVKHEFNATSQEEWMKRNLSDSSGAMDV